MVVGPFLGLESNEFVLHFLDIQEVVSCHVVESFFVLVAVQIFVRGVVIWVASIVFTTFHCTLLIQIIIFRIIMNAKKLKFRQG